MLLSAIRFRFRRQAVAVPLAAAWVANAYIRLACRTALLRAPLHLQARVPGARARSAVRSMLCPITRQ
jgi:hypothetical protein